MVKFKTVIGFLSLFLFGYGAYYFYQLTNNFYSGKALTEYSDYSIYIYFFGWIGYALAAVCALVFLYCIYYFLSTLWASIRKSKY